MSNFEEKYMKALRSIEEILKANRQIKEELDALRTMRQAEIDSCTNIQNEEFRKAYDALLQDKNNTAIHNQTLELENERLKYDLAELEQQLANAQPHPKTPAEATPTKAEGREAELRRTIENYEEHHVTLQRNCKRLEQRNAQLEGKLLTTEKSWRNKLEAKELEVVQVKARARQELGEQLTALRKENAALKLANAEIAAKLESCQQSALLGQQIQNMDWEGDLLRELTVVRANLQPLRQQITDLQDTDHYQRENAARERASLQARVLQLEADAQRYNQTIRQLEKKLIEDQKEKSELASHQEHLRKLEEENQLLNGRIIVMESREVALRNRTGEELEERVLEFQNRIQLLLANKQGLRELREVGIHQLIALKAYIMELDSRLKELLLSNGYLLKKYKSYKEKYQASLKESKQQALANNALKMKMIGYEKLVLKQQAELEAALKIQINAKAVRRSTEQTSQDDLYRRKYDLLQEKMEIQEKHKIQELETLKLSYEEKIMKLTIRAEQNKSLKETIELYRAKNEQLQGLLSRKESETDSKILTNSKVINSAEADLPRGKDIINTLHATLKQNDETIFRLQSEMRNREETHKRTLRKMEKELEDAKDQHTRDIARKELDFTMTLDQEVKKYKLRVAELEHSQQYAPSTSPNKEEEQRICSMQKRLEAAESAKEEEIFNRRRLQKQILDLNQDIEDLQRSNHELQLKLTQVRAQLRQFELSSPTQVHKSPRDSHLDYELQSKDAIIKRLNNQLMSLKSSLTDKPPVGPSGKNQIHYLKNEIEELKFTITQHNNQKNAIKLSLQTSKNKLAGEFEATLQEKQAIISKLRKDLAAKQSRVRQFEEEAGKLSDQIRRFKRELSEVDRLRQQLAHLQAIIMEKERTIQQFRSEQSSYDIELDRIKQQLIFVKENYQKISYESREKSDELEKMKLDLIAANSKSSNNQQARLRDELIEKEQQYARISSQLYTIKSSLTATEQERRYHQDSYRRANSDILSLRQDNSHLRQENDDLRNQIATINQEIMQMRFALESYRRKSEEAREWEEQNYRIKTEFFSLKSDISNLQEQLFAKQSAITRLSNQINFLKANSRELQEEIDIKQQYINKITAEYNLLRDQHMETTTAIDERQSNIQRLAIQLANANSKAREAEQQLEERSTIFTNLTQELNRLKNNLVFYEQEIDTKNRENSKLANQKETIAAEVLSLNQTLSEKHIEINKIRQQMMTLRFDASERDYQEKMRADRQSYAFRSKIASLQRELDDKAQEIRRMQAEKRMRPETPTIDFEAQQLRTELERTQKELLLVRRQNQFEEQNLQANIKTLKTTLAEREQQLTLEQSHFQRLIAQAKQRERLIGQEMERTAASIQGFKLRSQKADQLQKELALARNEISANKEGINSYRHQLQLQNHQKLQLQEQLRIANENNFQMQQNFQQIKRQIYHGIAQQHQQTVIQLQNKCNQLHLHIQHLQNIVSQYEIRIHQLSHHCQQLQRNQHNYQQSIQQIHFHYQKQISHLHSQLNSKITPSSTSVPAITSTLSLGINPAPQDHALIVNPYLEEIDRLNNIIRQLEEDLSAFKLKLFSMINHENRIEQNLSAMVRLFNEVITVRQNIEVRQAEIGQVRRSFVQKAASADGESGRSSRQLSPSGQHLSSSRQFQHEKAKIEKTETLHGSLVQQGQQLQARSSLIARIGNPTQNNTLILQQPGPSSLILTQSSQQLQQISGQRVRILHPVSSTHSQLITHGASAGPNEASMGMRPAIFIPYPPSTSDSQSLARR